MIIYICLMLARDDKVVLTKRCNTGWMDDLWHIPGGGLETGESLMQAAVREAAEEMGVEVSIDSIGLFHILQKPGAIGFYFVTYEWQNEPINKEPDECSGVEWFSLDALPTDINPFSQKVLEAYKEGLDYTFVE